MSIDYEKLMSNPELRAKVQAMMASEVKPSFGVAAEKSYRHHFLIINTTAAMRGDWVELWNGFSVQNAEVFLPGENGCILKWGETLIYAPYFVYGESNLTDEEIERLRADA